MANTSYSCLVLLLFTNVLFGQLDSTSFITAWDTRLTSLEDSLSITIPTADDVIYDYNIDWDNDGVFDEMNVSGDVTHVYDQSGIYVVRISGDFPRILVGLSDQNEKLVSIDQWGTIRWKSMKSAFGRTFNMSINAIDSPDLSLVESTEDMFRSAHKMNDDINHWDLSSVKSIARMFYGAISFNQDLDQWNVSNVENMQACFFSAENFNGDISSWNLSKVTNLSNMFYQAFKFNRDISQWDLSQVENIHSMFVFARDFNQDISGWDVSNVTDMHHMFYDANAFDQDLCTWDVSSVKDMNNMFTETDNFNGDISCWDVSAVENFAGMFRWASSFNSDISGWNTENADQTAAMFYLASSFDQNLGGWDLSNVSNMRTMFDNSGMSTDSYDKTLKGWYKNASVKQGAVLGAKSLTYCNGKEYRDSLFFDFELEIRDDIYDCLDVSLDEDNFQYPLINFYPLPVSEVLFVKCKLGEKICKIEILNASGEIVYLESTLNQLITIDMTKFSAGVYILKTYVVGRNCSLEKIIKL